MNLDFGVIGLPLETLWIVGGLFIISALTPSILAILLKHKRVW